MCRIDQLRDNEQGATARSVHSETMPTQWRKNSASKRIIVSKSLGVLLRNSDKLAGSFRRFQWADLTIGRTPDKRDGYKGLLLGRGFILSEEHRQHDRCQDHPGHSL